MKKKKKKGSFWQRLKAFIVKPKREPSFTKAMEGKVKIELDTKALKKLGETIGGELMKVIAKILLDKRWTDYLVTKLKKELLKELLRSISRVKPLPEPKKITIKESFINPIEENVKLKPSFSKKLKGKKISGVSLEKSLKALKKSHKRLKIKD